MEAKGGEIEMLNNIIRLVATLIGFALGYQLALTDFAVNVMAMANIPATPYTTIATSITSGSVFGLIFYFITPWVINRIVRFTRWVESKMTDIPTQDIALGFLGVLLGLLIASPVSFAIYRIPLVGTYLSPGIMLVLAYLGFTVVNSRKEELAFFTNLFKAGKAVEKQARLIKVLDTSVIIDGRIMDICTTGFVEGVMIIPGFVLEELRHIADSSDLLKRNRGRRGLDILNKMQKDLKVPVQIWEEDFKDLAEVDTKLVRLTKKLKGKIVTNDYNLNKVCELQGVPVLNINELANAVKPVVLPGEEMAVQVIKDGKEAGQGVAYLDDGTMIVVENGRRYIGDKLEVVVTSVLQTAAGRMIFAKPKTSMDQKAYSGVK
jgi:uncharacterized protein YacL